MTLQAGLVHGSSAYLWCDTAYFDFSGNVISYETKAMTGESWPWCGIWSVVGGNPFTMMEAVGEPQDVPSLLASVRSALRIYAAQGHLARVLVAAWQDRPQLWLVATDEATGEPFEPCEAVHYLNGAADLPEYRHAVKRGLRPRRMLDVIDAQLAAPVAASGTLGTTGQCVRYGGQLLEIRVSATGVGSRVVRSVDRDSNTIAEAA